MHRMSVLLLLVTLVALPLAAADHAPEQILVALLDLDEGQRAQLGELLGARQAALADAGRRMTELQGRLGEELNAPQQDPSVVGTIVLSMRAIERELMQHQQNFRSSFQATLNDEQRRRVETMKTLHLLQAGGSALERLGL